MSETPVDRMYAGFKDLVILVDSGREPSLVTFLNDNFRRSLLLCAASYFETRIKQYVLEFVEEKSHPTRPRGSFCSEPGHKQAVSHLV